MEIDILKESITEWVAAQPDDMVFEPKDGFYSFTIVAEAYQKGMEDERKRFIEEMRLKYLDKAKLVVSATNELIKGLSDRKFVLHKFILNHSLSNSLVLLTTDEGTNVDDAFISYVFNEAARIKFEYSQKGLNVSFMFIDEQSKLNIELLKSDGFDFGYSFDDKKVFDL